MNAISQAAFRLTYTIEEGATRWWRWSGAVWHHGEANDLTFGILTIEVVHGIAGIARVLVDDEGCACAAIGAVVEELGGYDGSFALEEVLPALVGVTHRELL